MRFRLVLLAFLLTLSANANEELTPTAVVAPAQAFVQGKWYRPKEKIGDYTIHKIQKNGVVYELAGRPLFVPLKRVRSSGAGVEASPSSSEPVASPAPTPGGPNLGPDPSVHPPPAPQPVRPQPTAPPR